MCMYYIITKLVELPSSSHLVNPNCILFHTCQFSFKSYHQFIYHILLSHFKVIVISPKNKSITNINKENKNNQTNNQFSYKKATTQ